jgi:hypothetical protein
VGTATVTGKSNVTLVGVSADGQVGGIISGSAIEGVSAAGQVGAVSVVVGQTVFLTGVSAYGEVDRVLVWGAATPGGDPIYTVIAPTSDPEYIAESPSQGSIWRQIVI